MGGAFFISFLSYNKYKINNESGLNMRDPHPSFVHKFMLISEVLMDYGWFASPYMSGGDFNQIFELCRAIQEKKIDLSKEDVEEKMYDILMPVIFHPNYRAFYIYRAKELLHLQKFSHHIERAILHYYKKDFFSCVLTLLPAIEGILLSHYGWEFKDDEKAPPQKKITNHLQNLAADSTKIERYGMYADTLFRFTKKWIFTPTDKADFSSSYLNRHYALHGLGTEHFYTASDCHRLILFLDLYTEVIGLENNEFYGLIPENIDEINKRSDYYFMLIDGEVSYNNMISLDNYLLEEHPFYHIEQNAPNWEKVLELENQRMTKVFELMEKFKKSNLE